MLKVEGYWQELIDSMAWYHQKLKIVPSIQGRAEGSFIMYIGEPIEITTGPNEVSTLVIHSCNRLSS